MIPTSAARFSMARCEPVAMFAGEWHGLTGAKAGHADVLEIGGDVGCIEDLLKLRSPVSASRGAM